MNTAHAVDDTSPEVLRAAMVERALAAGYAQSLRVQQVMRAVPRHLFVPEASLQNAYAQNIVVTKRREDGAVLSCASQPNIVALMLDQLLVRGFVESGMTPISEPITLRGC